MSNKHKKKNNTTQTSDAETTDTIETHVPAITVAANNNRVALILTASSQNQQRVWIGGEINRGIPLHAGEKITLKTNQAITLLGEQGDQVFMAELQQEGPC